MQTTTNPDELGHELYELVASLEPAQWRDEARESLESRFESFRTRLETWLDEHEGDVEQARQHWNAIEGLLREHMPEASDVRDAWMDFRTRLHPKYEALADALRGQHVELPSLRPTNYTRSIFHVGSAFLALLFIQYTPWDILSVVAIVLALMGWTMEISRRRSERINALLMRLFSHVSHPHERFRVNSATWYTTALALLGMTQSPAACALAVTALGVGDPAAALIGRRYGKTRIVHGRSLEGTLTFFAVSTVASLAVLQIWHAEFGLGTALIIASIASAAGALTELYSGRVDDNFSIPVVTGLVTLAIIALV